MSLNNNQMGIVTRPEAVAGTYEAPQAADSNIIIWGAGQPTINFGNESQGKLLDGSFDDAPVAGGQQSITFPDYMFNFFHDGADGITEPAIWEDLKACGAKVDNTAVQLALVFDGTPSCNTRSGKMRNLDCAGDGYDYAGRGMRGNVTIGWSGANAPIVCTVTGMTGAFVSETPVAGVDPYAVTGNDTHPKELAANYTVTVDATVYQVPVLEFNPGYTVSMEPANNESGIAQAKITAGEKRLRMSLLQLSAGDTVLTKAQLNSLFDVTVAGSGDAGYDITFSDVEFLEPSKGEVDGSTVWEIEAIVKSASFLMKDLVP